MVTSLDSDVGASADHGMESAMSYRLALAGTALLLSGCSSSSPYPKVVQVPAPVPPPAVQSVAAPTETGDGLSALAETTAAYARSMGGQSAVPRPAAASQPARPAALDDLVIPEISWPNPNELNLSLGPKQRDEPLDPPPGESSTKESAKVQPSGAAERPSADALEQRLADRLKQSPTDLATHLDYQLLQLVKGGQVPQLTTIASLAADDREILSALLDGLANFRAQSQGEANLTLARKIRPLLDVADRLRPQASLRIPSVALCTRVDGFGVYEPLAAARFISGPEHAFVVYCEVDNFASQFKDTQQWETRLTQEIVLYDETGQRAWSEKPRQVVDLSRNRRRDFFLARIVKLPSALPAGVYVLRLTVTDDQASRVTEASTLLEIVKP